MPNKNKWQIHKVSGRWVVRMAKGENPPAGKKETKEIRETDKKINRDNENPPHEGTHKERGKK
jgi:hypothetical protein